MKIPEKVKIGGLVYTVEVTDRLVLGPDFAGEVTYSDLTIRIRPAAQASMEQTFLHELTHAIYEFLGYRNHDEKQVDEFASVLHALITDNPGLFAEERDAHDRPSEAGESPG